MDSVSIMDGSGFPSITFDGRLKWFSTDRDYGFVVCNETGADALLPGRVLRDFGTSSISDGSRVVYNMAQTAQGDQVTEILELEILDDVNANDGDVSAVLDFASEQFEPGRVKWFDAQRGYGFVNLYADTSDFFLHASALKTAGIEAVEKGEALSVMIDAGAKGKVVMAVRPWGH